MTGEAETNGRAVELFAARSAIETNLARHSRGVDRRDAGLLASTYTPDGAVDYGMFAGPASTFAEILTGAMAGAPPTLHRTGNMLIRVAGDRARSESYVIAYTRTIEEGDASRHRLIGGRYLDRHARADGAWKIAHRTYVLDWNINLDAGVGLPNGGSAEGDAATAALFAGFAAARQDERTDMASLDQALAKQALHDLVATCARATDRGDAALMASAFHADADVVTGYIDGKAPEFARDVVAMVRTHLASCFHSVGNEYFEVDGDRAVGETYVLAHQLTQGDAPTQTLTGGRYLDRFERRDGRWAIAGRRFVQDWTISQPATMETGGMYEPLGTRGGWLPDDPSAAFWSEWTERR